MPNPPPIFETGQQLVPGTFMTDVVSSQSSIAAGGGIVVSSQFFSIVDWAIAATTAPIAEVAANLCTQIQIMCTKPMTILGVRFLTAVATTRAWRVGAWINGTLKASNTTAQNFGGVRTAHSINFDSPYVVQGADLYRPITLGQYENTGSFAVKLNATIANYLQNATTLVIPNANDPSLPLPCFWLGPGVMVESLTAGSTGFTSTPAFDSFHAHLEPILSA